NFVKWADFTNEPLSINQSSLSKIIRLMLRKDLIRKDETKKEYSITQFGKLEYSNVLQYYDLDRQTILEEESRLIEEITKKTISFFYKYEIKQKKNQFRFLNNCLKLNFDRVSSILKNEEDYYRIILFLSINHPYQYPEYISPDQFSRDYGIKENTLSYYVDEIVENEIYPIKFFKLTTSDNKYYYFQENEKLETMIRAICENSIKELTYLNKLFSESKSIKSIVDDILEEICTILLDEGLKEALNNFLPEYLKYLAYKIEAVGELKESYDKLEGIIWQNMANMFHSKRSESLENQYKEELVEIDDAIGKDQNNIELYYSKIKLLIYFGRYDTILSLIDKMLEIFPNDEVEIKLKKASILKRMKSLEEGLTVINSLIKDYPDNYDLLTYKAYWLQYLDRKEESLAIISKLIKDFPENGTYYDTYGEILMYFEVYEKAIVQFQKALEFAGEEWFINQTYIKLGICHKELGNPNLALEYLKKGKEFTSKTLEGVELKQKWDKIADLFINEIESS
ncbi:MAG: hypothetical protein ACFE8N_10670, partial [Promethearchaeota archaeon]